MLPPLGTRRSSDDLNLNPNSIKPYKSALNHFVKFQEVHGYRYCLKDIDQKLVKAFTNYLNEKLAVNTSAKYLTVFKLLISYANEKKLIDFQQAFEVKVIVRREKSDNIYLNEQEIEALMWKKQY